ncbi:peptidoglycan-associated lipoprotein Pal [Pseudazoarcus pumilus]|uniref:Peptidoglycan-associated lipoprotein n=1 Tax=Pseudazoarcus pumilus TaxID=2067960 RepID=A0A2I6S3H7_9RHOO|nr:peptidoglycan-associated lipoprotein Pal [Pseudazoarcus pumilus]AUN93795.1 peptidoglycan-associated lipoprotein [Pseudazoarcus pumilus]
MKKVLLPALLASLLIACSGTGDQAADGTAGSAGASGSDTTTAAVSDSSISRNDMGALAGGDASGSSATDGSASGSIASLTDPNHILSQRTIYFDFDSFVIRPEFADLIDAHAAFLKGHGQIKMMIQGNTDERGSREYNLALGQKRAEAVKRALVLLGVDETQIESVSLGEEKPRCTESTESCWAENRRSDMLYTGEF